MTLELDFAILVFMWACVVVLFSTLLWWLRHDIKEKLFDILAEFLAQPCVAGWLIRRAMRTPYSHLPSNDDPSYMRRYWLFNPYERVALRDSGTSEAQSYMMRWPWFPWSFRIHHIVREDNDRHMHDHPWNARTFILRGFYVEERLVEERLVRDGIPLRLTKTFFRHAGCSAPLRFGEYHTVKEVSSGGVWTLFVTSRYQGTWGFLVNGFKVPYREYFQAQCQHVWRLNNKQDGYVCHSCGAVPRSHDMK